MHGGFLCGYGQNGVIFDLYLHITLNINVSQPKIIGFLTKLFCISGPNLVVLACTITLTPYMVLPLFATRFADYAGGIWVPFIQPRLFQFDIKCSAWEIKLYRLIWMEFINMFSVYASSGTHSRFNWWIIVDLAYNPSVLMCVEIIDAPKL